MTSPKSDPSIYDKASKVVDGGGSQGQLDSTIQGTLGRKLRETYDEVVKEEVPEKFLELLHRLKAKEEKSDYDGS